MASEQPYGDFEMNLLEHRKMVRAAMAETVLDMAFENDTEGTMIATLVGYLVQQVSQDKARGYIDKLSDCYDHWYGRPFSDDVKKFIVEGPN